MRAQAAPPQRTVMLAHASTHVGVKGPVSGNGTTMGAGIRQHDSVGYETAHAAISFSVVGPPSGQLAVRPIALPGFGVSPRASAPRIAVMLV